MRHKHNNRIYGVKNKGLCRLCGGAYCEPIAPPLFEAVIFREFRQVRARLITRAQDLRLGEE